MSSVYDDDIAGALEMIREDGQLCKWHSKADTVATERWKPGVQTETLHEGVPIVVLPINRVLYESFRRLQPDVEVPQGRHAGYLPGACGFVPKLKDIVELTANLATPEFYAVQFYDVYKPDGLPILYVIQLHQQL